MPSCQNFTEQYPERYHTPHNYILQFLQGLNQSGEFTDRQKYQQSPRTNMLDENTELQVLFYIRANPRSSHVAREINIYMIVSKIFFKKIH